MRPEAKLAAVLSMGIILIVGLYWMYGTQDGQPVTTLDDPPGDYLLVRNEGGTPSQGVPLAARPPVPDERLVKDTGRQAARAIPAGGELPAPGEMGPTPYEDVPVGQEPLLRIARSEPLEVGPAAEPGGRAKMIFALPLDTGYSEPLGDAEAFDRHIVQSGDSFASIARMFFGHQRYARYLMEANPTVHDSGALPIGTVILVPPDPDDASSVRPQAGQGAPLAAWPPVPDERVAKKSGKRSKRGSRAGENKPRGATGSLPAREVSDDTGGQAASGTHADSPATVNRVERRTYTVKPGDTFYGISRNVLGNASRWKELLELNSELVAGEPRNLRPGQELVLPDQ